MSTVNAVKNVALQIQARASEFQEFQEDKHPFSFKIWFALIDTETINHD